MIIPIFVPHKGCRNDCAFCNQRTISGNENAPTIKEARNIIETYLKTTSDSNIQIAFFGGSFTGIDVAEQNEYLSLANEYIERGMVNSIRLSTRPDYIDDSTVKRLIGYGVKNIELGAQSMNEEVLYASNRGHSTEAVVRASEIIINNNVTLGLQMMTGLPMDSPEKDMCTAEEFIRLGAKETRIYPTIVLKGTKLEKMYYEKEYKPQTLEEAVETASNVKKLFDKNNVKVLRIGLPESISLKDNHIAGPYHSAFGELVASRIIRKEIEKDLSDNFTFIEIKANPVLVSKVVGNKRCNIDYFRKKGITMKVIPDSTVKYVQVSRQA